MAFEWETAEELKVPIELLGEDRTSYNSILQWWQYTVIVIFCQISETKTQVTRINENQ